MMWAALSGVKGCGCQRCREPWRLIMVTPAVCACRWAGLLATPRGLALEQRGLVDAALGPEHGCGDHHGQMGVQVSQPAQAPLLRTLQL